MNIFIKLFAAIIVFAVILHRLAQLNDDQIVIIDVFGATVITLGITYILFGNPKEFK